MPELALTRAPRRPRSDLLSPPRVPWPARRRSGQDDLVVLLVTQHAESVLRITRRFSLCDADADDAYQRAVEILLHNAGRLDPERAASWLRTVAKHEALAIRAQRSDGVARDGHDPDEHVATEVPSTEEQVARADRFTRAAEALRGLKPDETRALWLRAEGYSYADAAGNGQAFDASRAATRTIWLDGTAPASPTGLTGGGRRNSPSFTLNWLPPTGQVAPIEAIMVRLCRLPDGDCTQQTLDGAPTTVRLTLPVPDTDFLASFWGRDEAGNENAANAASTLLRYHLDPATGRDPEPGAGPTTSETTTGSSTVPNPVITAPAPGPPPTPKNPRLKITQSRYTASTRRLTITGTAATGVDTMAAVRLSIVPRAVGNRIAPRTIHASRATTIAADRNGRFTRSLTLAASTGRAIRAGRTTTLTLVTRASATWQAAAPTHAVPIRR